MLPKVNQRCAECGQPIHEIRSRFAELIGAALGRADGVQVGKRLYDMRSATTHNGRWLAGEDVPFSFAQPPSHWGDRFTVGGAITIASAVLHHWLRTRQPNV